MKGSRVIYLDNAATSWPKPRETWRAMENFMRHIGANPGRSGHRLSIEAARIVLEARMAVAELLGIEDPLRVVFSRNATEALNLAINGILRPGDHVIISSMEHNSVMRPLRALEKRGVEIKVLACSPEGELNPQEVEQAIRGNTRLIVMNHASNVVGTLIPLAKVGETACRNGVIFCVDAAQTAGAYPIDVEDMKIDLLAFTGHKSLYGPQGTGGLYIREGLEGVLEPLMRGGTGSRSEFQEQPDFLPDRYESGTPNTVGLAGLSAGVRFVLSQRIVQIRANEEAKTQLLIGGLESISGVVLYGSRDARKQIAVVSFNIAGLTPSEVVMELEEEFQILCRPGLHCAPAAHQTIGSFPQGTVRLSPGYLTTEEEIHVILEAVGKIAARVTEGGVAHV
ncbi:MAG: aminotransferase class V-fold PLP-dependent enzyme [Syntrophobacterales bacterium]|nr:MAG: aminotransferase class V-fold PLP-dependent enzyme [Syntrophobacterales bacterium]